MNKIIVATIEKFNPLHSLTSMPTGGDQIKGQTGTVFDGAGLLFFLACAEGGLLDSPGFITCSKSLTSNKPGGL